VLVSLLLTGCARQGPEPVRLTLISPHRDEIRHEVGLAFRDWFRARTDTRITAACTALQEWLKTANPKQLTPAETAVTALFHDWRTADLGDLPTAYHDWQQRPGPTTGQALLEALIRFQERIPPVELVWQDVGGGTSQMARYIRARFDANPEGIGIDLLYGGGTENHLTFAAQGRLEEIALPEALFRGRIPRQLNGIDLYDANSQQRQGQVTGRWFGPILSSFGILYNREVLRRIGRAEPSRWADLGERDLSNWVSAGDPRLTGSVHLVYEIILQGQGWDKGFALLLRLGANAHSFIRDSGTLTRTVIEGEVAAAGSLDGNALPAVGRDPDKMGFVLPAGETVINPDAVGVLKGAPRKELARAFVEFTLSDAGQLLFLLQPGQPGGPQRSRLCRLSVVEDLYRRYPPEVRSVGAADPFEVGKNIAYNSKLAQGRWDALNDLFGATIQDAHQDLAAAWRAVQALYDLDRKSMPLPDFGHMIVDEAGAWAEHLERELFVPPCSEDDLRSFARTFAEGNPRERVATINHWGKEARQRYQAIRRRAEELAKHWR
jgi:ABC-type Fe3+ transport system substrate-binding protein